MGTGSGPPTEYDTADEDALAAAVEEALEGFLDDLDDDQLKAGDDGDSDEFDGDDEGLW